jgi:hypothetical protein
MPIENKPHRASPSALAHLDGLRPSGCNGVRRMSRRPETLIQAQNEIEIFVFSVTSNDFPHDMLLLTFSSNLGSKLWCRRYLHQNPD